MFTCSMQLVQEAQSGEPVAKEEIARKIYQDILDWALRRAFPSEQDAEDFANWVAWKITESLPRFQWRSNFSTWVWSFIVREEAEFYRKLGRSMTTSSINDIAFEPTDTSENMPDKIIEKQEDQTRLSAAITSLSALDQQIVVARFDGLPFQEIAKILDADLVAVKSQFYRVIAKLRKKLEEN